MGKIRWLHISDLHYDREMMGDWPAGQNGFPVTGIDFIVFTGDMHTYGRDYNEGKRFLTELAKHYNLNPKQGKTTVPYKKISANGTTREQQICMTEYIRHQIHHPENTYNARFNDSQLRRSIEDMRAFVTSKAQTPETT